nr:NusG domain II-containing protein [Enterococcus sp. 669A]
MTIIKIKKFFADSLWKPWDGIIIGVLVLFSLLPLVIFSVYQKTNLAERTQAVLRVDGEEIERFDLAEGQDSYTYTYEDPDGDYNLIEISGERIRVKEASCRDQVCVRRGWIEETGDTIVCLPHKMVIEIV